MFWANLKRRITALAVQVALASKPGISNTAKSSYYRSGAMLMYTIIEGVVYQLVKKYTNPNNIILTKVEHTQLLTIPKTVFNTAQEVYICLKTPVEVHIDDKGVDFGKLNLYLKNKNIISLREYRILEAIRKQRNKIHVQSLASKDVGYTLAKLESASKCLDFLLIKILRSDKK